MRTILFPCHFSHPLGIDIGKSCGRGGPMSQPESRHLAFHKVPSFESWTVHSNVSIEILLAIGNGYFLVSRKLMRTVEKKTIA
jgi:hypothetical protein